MKSYSGFWLMSVLMIVSAGCRWLSGASEPPTMSIAEAENFIGQEFPPSASEIFVSNLTGINIILYIRFSASPQESVLFLENIGFQLPLRADYRPFQTEQNSVLRWWNIDQITKFSGDELMQAGKVYEVIVDESNIQRWVLFLRVYTL